MNTVTISITEYDDLRRQSQSFSLELNKRLEEGKKEYYQELKDRISKLEEHNHNLAEEVRYAHSSRNGDAAIKERLMRDEIANLKRQVEKLTKQKHWFWGMFL